MADQRCPFCGKSNPAGASVCQYCQARLKPLVASNSGEPVDLSSIFSQNQEPEESVPDWLKDLRGPEPEPETDGQAEETLDASALEEEAPEPELAGELQNEMPDWLARIRERSSDEQPLAPEESQEEEPGLSLEEYLAQQESQQSADVAEEAAPPVTDWLEAIGRLQREQEAQAAGQSMTGQPVAEQVSETSSEEVSSTPVEMSEPDWLQQARGRRVEETPVDEDQPSASHAEETLEPSIASPDDDVDDWLAEIGLPQESAAPPDGEFSYETPFSMPVEPQGEDGLEESATPDWLANWTDAAPEPAPEEQNPFPEETAVLPEEASSAEPAPEAEPESSVPEWLLNLEAISIPAASESTPAFILDENGLDGTEGQPLEGSELASYTPPGADGLPDWLAQVSSEEAGEASAEAEGEEDQGEAPVEAGQLPGWLEAMRPVETVTPVSPVVESAGAEKAGPLAGLKGALLAEELVQPYKKPKLQSIRLQVSDAQQAHVDLLEQLLATEGEPKPVVKRKPKKANNVLRALIFIVLLLALLVPTALGTQLFAPPALPADATEVSEAYRLVNTLAANDAVLLAFDYQPGTTGEMDLLANQVIGQMEARKAYLTAISSSPVGPFMAERLIAKTNTGATPFYQNYTNLGYIPGGISGLAALAADPRQAVPYDMNGQAAWATWPLTSVGSLSDFHLVVVFSENPDTARTWIEQVGPTLAEKNVPLMMVVSAQAEPLVRPYFESTPRQVSALIAGLRGGAMYEEVTGQPGAIRRVWDSYSLGLLAAAAIIFFGGLVALIAGLISAARRPEAEGKV